MKVARALAVAGFAALAAACTAGDVVQAPADDAELVRGQAVYTSSCASCHGSAGGGGRGSQLTEGKVLAAYPEVEDQIELMNTGKGLMPAFNGRLVPEDIQAVVRYTREVLN